MQAVCGQQITTLIKCTQRSRTFSSWNMCKVYGDFEWLILNYFCLELGLLWGSMRNWLLDRGILNVYQRFWLGYVSHSNHCSCTTYYWRRRLIANLYGALRWEYEPNVTEWESVDSKKSESVCQNRIPYRCRQQLIRFSHLYMLKSKSLNRHR